MFDVLHNWLTPDRGDDRRPVPLYQPWRKVQIAEMFRLSAELDAEPRPLEIKGRWDWIAELMVENHRLRVENERLRQSRERGVGPDDPAGCPAKHGAQCCGWHDACRESLEAKP